MSMKATAIAVLAALGLALAGCAETSVSNKEDPLAKDVIDDANLSELLLAAGNPADAVRYFEQALEREPDRAHFRRGLAKSLARVKRYPESARVYEELTALGQDEPEDRLDYGYVAIRLDRWDDAARLAASLPGGMNLPRRHVLDALVADHSSDWATADAAYARAESLSPNPAEVLNNWGVSQMSRGNLTAAERTFDRAVSYDSRLFEAKNNLALSRGLQGNYQMPVVPLTDTERATILNNLGLIALRRNETRIAKGLFAEAVATHPEHYQAAADRLAALEATIVQ